MVNGDKNENSPQQVRDLNTKYRLVMLGRFSAHDHFITTLYIGTMLAATFAECETPLPFTLREIMATSVLKLKLHIAGFTIVLLERDYGF